MFIMISLPVSVGEDIMFSACPSSACVRPFVRPNRIVTMISHERLEQFRWNLQEIFITPTDNLLDSGDQRSKVKVTAGRRGGEGIHIDVEASKFIFWW